MSAERWILLASFAVFAAAAVYYCLKVLLAPRAADPAETRGDVLRAVAYSFTGAMSPLKKESARRHVPTYVFGLVFHAGVFIASAWVVIFFFGLEVPLAVATVSVPALAATSLAGVILLLKRITRRKLRYFSTPDDYFSNILVVGFQAVALAALVNVDVIPALMLYASAVLLYVPLGKLRHAIYFPLARVYLGLFFGKRGVWGSRKRERWEVRDR
jgi:hypothetical protein